jgi:hypothetical protein
MKRDIYDFDGKCQFAFNLDRLCAVDVIEEEGKWILRLFFSGVESGYRLSTPTKDVADKLYNDIVSRMKEVRVE